MAVGVTHQQNAAFKFIARYAIEHDGTPPSYDEIADHLTLKSKSGVSRIVAGLEKRGLIRRHPNMARSMEIVAGLPKPGFALPPDLQSRLDRFCQQQGENAAAVVIDAVTLHLDDLETQTLRSVQQ